MEHVLAPSPLNVFARCPRKYQAQVITKEIQRVQNKAMTRGNDIHSLMEEACNKGWEAIKWIEPQNEIHARGFVETIWRLRNNGWNVQVELQTATDGLGNVCGWWDKPPLNFMRSKIDICATHPAFDYALVIDWKTGKPWDDALQLHVNAMCLQPITRLNKYKVVFAYIDTGLTKDYDVVLDITQPAIFDRVQHMHSPVLSTLLVIDNLKHAYANNLWPATKNKFCRWCELTTCSNHP